MLATHFKRRFGRLQPSTAHGDYGTMFSPNVDYFCSMAFPTHVCANLQYAKMEGTVEAFYKKENSREVSSSISLSAKKLILASRAIETKRTHFKREFTETILHHYNMAYTQPSTFMYSLSYLGEYVEHQINDAYIYSLPCTVYYYYIV